MKITGNFNSIIIRTERLSDQEIKLVQSVYHENGKEVMYDYFKTKKILPFAAKTFCNLDIDSDFWLPILEQYRDRNNKIVSFLNAVYKALNDFGVKKAFVTENFAALLTSGCDIGLFASGDVDNCYDEEEKDRLYKALQSIGCTYTESYAVNRLNASAWFPPVEFGLPETFHIGFQPGPLSRMFIPGFVEMSDFDGWDGICTYRDTFIQIPNPSVLMYICMLHISLHSFSRAPDIRLYTDTLNMTLSEVDYSKIEAWSKKNRTKTRVSVAATLTNSLMKTSIPSNIVNQTNRKDKIIRLVYDQVSNDLIYEPKGLKVLQIECLCDDKGMLHGLISIAFPKREWMCKTYGNSNVSSYIKHIKRIL